MIDGRGHQFAPQQTGKSSCRIAVVVPQQSAKEPPAVNATELRRVVDGQVLWRSRCSRRQRAVAEALVRAPSIVKTRVRLIDVVQVAQTEAQEVVQCLAF
jgi:hypothetical protein